MSGLENDVLVAKNVNFDYTSSPPHAGIINADGQLLIGSTSIGGPALLAANITSSDGSIAITNGPGTIDLGLNESTIPAVQAQVNAVVVNNVTGDGTTYTVIFDNVHFDNVGNYNSSTGIFTALVTGKYLFGTNVTLFGVIVTNNNVLLNINQIGKTNQYSNFNPFPIVNGNSETTINASTMINMTAGDTVQITVRVDGNSTKNVGIAGDGNGAYSYFYGYRVS